MSPGGPLSCCRIAVLWLHRGVRLGCLSVSPQPRWGRGCAEPAAKLKWSLRSGGLSLLQLRCPPLPRNSLFKGIQLPRQAAKAPGCPDMPMHTFLLRSVCFVTGLKAFMRAGSALCPACWGLGFAPVCIAPALLCVVPWGLRMGPGVCCPPGRHGADGRNPGLRVLEEPELCTPRFPGGKPESWNRGCPPRGLTAVVCERRPG